MKLKMEFVEDWVQHLRAQLLAAGFPAQPGERADEVSFSYFNYLKRIVRPGPREILYASGFSCPSAMQTGLEIVVQKIVDGTDITPHLSTKIRDRYYDDDLLNDWGIYHVHLGTTVTANGFVNRTGPLLFARFDSEKAYFINVMPHGSWTKQEMLRCVHDNWPDSIKQYRINALDVERGFSDDEVGALSRGHVSAITKVAEGVIYSPLGGGITTSGLSAQVVFESDYYMKRMRLFEKALYDKVLEIEQLLPGVDEAQFHLQIDSHNICFAIEKSNLLRIKLGPIKG